MDVPLELNIKSKLFISKGDKYGSVEKQILTSLGKAMNMCTPLLTNFYFRIIRLMGKRKLEYHHEIYIAYMQSN